MKKLLILIPLLALCTSIQVKAQAFLQDRQSMQLTDWHFYKGDIVAADREGYSSLDLWEEVTVPHTYNAQDVLTNGSEYYQGYAWYLTEFKMDPKPDQGRVFVRFEGASMRAEVFFNGQRLGEHKGGYSAFIYELTPYMHVGEPNLLAVRVDNSTQWDIAPGGPNLYPLYGGIYRPVTVFTTSDACISPLDYASSGVYIQPQEVSAEKATANVQVLLNRKDASLPQSGGAELLPPEGMEGNGLFGRYYATDDFTGPVVHERLDPEISFAYEMGAPFDDMEVDYFSVIWTGRFKAKHTGRYRFSLRSDDGSRLYFRDKLIVDNSGNHGPIVRTGFVDMKAGEEVPMRIEYREAYNGATMKFTWTYMPVNPPAQSYTARIEAVDADGKSVAEQSKSVKLENGTSETLNLPLSIAKPHLWDGRRDPYLYTLKVSLMDDSGTVIDSLEQPLGLRYFSVDPMEGLSLNGQYYNLYGVSRHQEVEGYGPALSEEQHRRDFELIHEMGSSGIRFAHYQQAEIMFALSDEFGMVSWAEIPNQPQYQDTEAYLENTKQQLTELIKQNYNHPAILFWGLYNEIDIPADDVQALHDLAKKLDPARLTTAADFTQPVPRHQVTDLMAWNWYFGWYYDPFDKYTSWYDELHKNYPQIAGGLSEYGAGGSLTHQQENPERPDPVGPWFPEQYQRKYHEETWDRVQDRHDIWCKYIWNMFDFSWTAADRGDRPFINHKGMVTHDRKVKKDVFYFYKANWSEEPVLYICSRRNVERKEPTTHVEVYSNLDNVELYLNGELVSTKDVTSEIHKVMWDSIRLQPGHNQVAVVGKRDGKTYTDAVEWVLVEE